MDFYIPYNLQTMKHLLLIHGGAGNIASMSPEKHAEYRSSIAHILSTVHQQLEHNISATQAVTNAVSMLEDDTLYNAGRGSVFNHKGTIDLDASIMDGQNLQAGSVAAITQIQNPIQLAQAVMNHSEHVMLIGTEAQEFAAQQGFSMVPNSYFHTSHRLEQLKQASMQNKVVLDHSDMPNQKPLTEPDPKKYGTVGAVALDKNGNIAAATSTGGITNKKFGRIGDSPIIGAGTYADNQTMAISCTGYGEQFIRAAVAKHLSSHIYFTKSSLQTAAAETLEFLESKVQGLGGFITLNTAGEFCSQFNTPGMIHGVIGSHTPLQVSLLKKITS